MIHNEYGYLLDDALNRLSLYADNLTAAQLATLAEGGEYPQRAATEVAWALQGAEPSPLLADRLRQLIADGAVCFFAESYFPVASAEYDDNARAFGRWRAQIAELTTSVVIPQRRAYGAFKSGCQLWRGRGLPVTGGGRRGGLC